MMTNSSDLASEIPCEEVHRAIPLLLDDELDAEYSLELEQHLGECSGCRRELEREGELRLTLRRAVKDIAAPVSLRRKLAQAIDEDRRRTRMQWARWWPAAAAAGILFVFIGRGANGGPPADLSEAAQTHSANLPMDVVAGGMNELGRVESYFRERLPFAVNLPATRPIGIPVKNVGGRLVRLGDRDAAYVRYELAPGNRVSVLVYEDPSSPLAEVDPGYDWHRSSRRVQLNRVRGYTAARWNERGVVYSVVTDMAPRDLEHFLSYRPR